MKEIKLPDESILSTFIPLFFIFLITGLLALGHFGLLPKETSCKNTIHFNVGNDTLGASGTYCADLF